MTHCTEKVGPALAQRECGRELTTSVVWLDGWTTFHCPSCGLVKRRTAEVRGDEEYEVADVAS